MEEEKEKFGIQPKEWELSSILWQNNKKKKLRSQKSRQAQKLRNICQAAGRSEVFLHTLDAEFGDFFIFYFFGCLCELHPHFPGRIFPVLAEQWMN